MTDRPAPQLSSYATPEQARTYDLMYEGRKDYATEAERVTGLIRARKADTASLLDVACGTGGHLAAFAKDHAEIVGVDGAAPMVERARNRLPGVLIEQADMREFDLERTFDAVVCLFSSIAYLSTTTDLYDAVQSMAKHLVTGGVLVVEPWHFPDTFVPGFVSAHATRDGDRAIARVAHTARVGDTTRIEIHNLIGDPVGGVRHEVVADIIALFERDAYLDAFRTAGLRVEYLAPEFNGTGYFVGVRE